MIRSGIAPLDSHLGGLASGRLHLLEGGIGTGKTTACLHFLAAGLEAGETAALVTLDRPAELGSHAAYLGIDLETPLRDGRLVALRFGPGFSRRLVRAGTPAPLIEELRHAMARQTPPARIAIDTVSPFLADGSPTGAVLAAVAAFLEGLGSTTLLTCPASLQAGTDRRLDPVVERAAVIARLSHGTDGAYEMRIARARMTGAPRQRLRFVIHRAVGLVEAPEPKRGKRAADRVRAGNARRSS